MDVFDLGLRDRKTVNHLKNIAEDFYGRILDDREQGIPDYETLEKIYDVLVQLYYPISSRIRLPTGEEHAFSVWYTYANKDDKTYFVQSIITIEAFKTKTEVNGILPNTVAPPDGFIRTPDGKDHKVLGKLRETIDGCIVGLGAEVWIATKNNIPIHVKLTEGVNEYDTQHIYSTQEGALEGSRLLQLQAQQRGTNL